MTPYCALLKWTNRKIIIRHQKSLSHQTFDYKTCAIVLHECMVSEVKSPGLKLNKAILQKICSLGTRLSPVAFWAARPWNELKWIALYCIRQLSSFQIFAMDFFLPSQHVQHRCRNFLVFWRILKDENKAKIVGYPLHLSTKAWLMSYTCWQLISFRHSLLSLFHLFSYRCQNFP